MSQRAKHLMSPPTHSHYQSHRAFTLVELVVVIAVVGVLAGLAVIGLGAWRTNVATTEIKSDLANLQAGMEDARNRTNTYPVFPEGTEFNGVNDTRHIFTPSKNVKVLYNKGNGTSYCIDIQSKVVSAVYLFLDTASGSSAPQQGTCDGGSGATPPTASQTVFVFDTSAPGCTGTVQLPVSSPTSGGTVSWGDGTTEARTGSLMAHTYSTPKTYVATFDGTISAASYAYSVNATNAKCLKKVTQWGSSANPTTVSFYNASNLVYVAEPPTSLVNFSNMFYNATSFNQDIGHWNTARATSMSSMFSGARAFNQNISGWNTSNVTSMSNMFWDARTFNQPIGSWDTSKVTTMSGMFYDAQAFNQDVSGWNTSNVTAMSYMFVRNYSFNQPIGSWDTSKVTNMAWMLLDCYSFNQPIGNWNTSNVVSMERMFQKTPFNQPIGSWNTSKVTSMSYMFLDATAFNQPIGSWNTSSVQNFYRMFLGADSFNQPIGSWNTSNATNMEGMFYAADSFNQPIGSWDTSKVTNMAWMFFVSPFNQNISGWNVTNVTSWANFHESAPLTQANCPPKLW